jgi:hypothetical protein
MSSSEGVSTAVLIDGLAEAVKRLRAAPAPPGRGAVAGFQAIFEVVAWAGAVRDRFLQDGGVAIPQELEGLSYVRNLVLHRGASVLESIIVTPGSELGIWVLGESRLGEASVWQWRWPPRSSLPKNRGKDPPGSLEYDSHVAGHLALELLDALLVTLLET